MWPLDGAIASGEQTTTKISTTTEASSLFLLFESASSPLVGCIVTDLRLNGFCVRLPHSWKSLINCSVFVLTINLSSSLLRGQSLSFMLRGKRNRCSSYAFSSQLCAQLCVDSENSRTLDLADLHISLNPGLCSFNSSDLFSLQPIWNLILFFSHVWINHQLPKLMKVTMLE